MSLCSFLVLIATSFLQLASDPDAEELLVDTLLAFEEADKVHCARFSGTLSGIQEGEPKIIEVFGVSAKKRDLEFHSYGSQGPAGVQWFNALRDSKTHRSRFKTTTGSSKSRSKDLPFETDNDPDVFWPWPEMNPFGMVFGSESRMSKRESAIGKVRTELTTQFEFQKSRLLANGNREGTWLALPNHAAHLVVEFDKKSGNLPILTKWELVKEKRVLGLAKTKWIKFDKSDFVPETMSIYSERSDGTTVQLDLKWEWCSKGKWLEWSDKKFAKLFDQEVQDFRTPIIELFEENAGRSNVKAR